MSALQRLDQARTRVMLRSPFFATLLMTTPCVETTSIPTAAVDDKNLYYNPRFIESLDSVEDVIFVAVHEVMHKALAHVWRLKERDRRLWNIACDYVINLMLTDSGLKIPCIKGVPIKVMHDKRYAGMSADEVYARLLRRPPPPEAQSGWGDKDGDGDMRQPSPASAEQQAQAEMDAAQSLQQAALAAGGRVPDAVARMIDQLVNPRIPWQDLLRHLIVSSRADDNETWARRNRRFRNVYLPTYESERADEIAFIGDTSGSITAEALTRVAVETASCAEQMNPERLRILWCDTDVRSEQVFEDGEPVVGLKPRGGGGTDMRVALKYVEKYQPSTVVLMTDGYTPWPTTPPPYHLIVCCTTSAPVPLGEVVRIR